MCNSTLSRWRQGDQEFSLGYVDRVFPALMALFVFREHYKERGPVQSRDPSALSRFPPESFLFGGPRGSRGDFQHRLASGQIPRQGTAHTDLPEGVVSFWSPGHERDVWAPGWVPEAHLVVPSVPAAAVT